MNIKDRSTPYPGYTAIGNPEIFRFDQRDEGCHFLGLASPISKRPDYP